MFSPDRLNPSAFAVRPGRLKAVPTGPVASRLHIAPRKPLVMARDLRGRALEVYRILIRDPLFARGLYWVKTHRATVSGRVLDALMTKYPHCADAYYYVDRSCTPSRFVSAEAFSSMPRSERNRLELCDLYSTYRTHMSIYSKTYFDTFGRGYEVMHPIGTNGLFVTFSLCKLMFAIFSQRYHVEDFLRHNSAKVAEVAHREQQAQRQRRRAKRRGEPPLPLSRPLPPTTARPRTGGAILCPQPWVSPRPRKYYRVGKQ
jgi:hypothetical protein